MESEDPAAAEFTRPRQAVAGGRRDTVDLSAFDLAPMLEDFGKILEQGTLQRDMAGPSDVAKNTRTTGTDIQDKERMEASARARERIFLAAAEKTKQRFAERQAEDADASRRRRIEREYQRKQKDAALTCLSRGLSSVAARRSMPAHAPGAAGRMYPSVVALSTSMNEAGDSSAASVARQFVAADSAQVTPAGQSTAGTVLSHSEATPGASASPPPRRPEVTPVAMVEDDLNRTAPPRRDISPPRRDILDRNIANIRMIEDAMMVNRTRALRSPPRVRGQTASGGVGAGMSPLRIEKPGGGDDGNDDRTRPITSPAAHHHHGGAAAAHHGGLTPRTAALLMTPGGQSHISSVGGTNSTSFGALDSTPSKADALAAARARRNAALRTSRQRHADHADQRAKAFAENSKALADLNDTVMRIASWQVTVIVVVAFKAMDEQSTAVIRREREARRRRAELVMVIKVPHLFRMYRRRKRIRMFRRAAVTLLAWVKFKGMRKHRAADVARGALQAVQGDMLIMFRAYVRTIRSVKRLSSRKALFRRAHQVALLKQWTDMELYMMLTRPDLILSATELRTCSRLRKLDDETSEKVSAAIARRNQLAVRAAEFESSIAGSVRSAPPTTNPDLGKYTLVPQELVPAAYGDAPYFVFLTAYKKHCAKLRIPLLPREIDDSSFHCLPALRSKEIHQFKQSYLRKQMRAVKTCVSTHFSSRQTAVDMLDSAMRTRRDEALVRVREAYPTVLAGTPIHRVLIELEVATSRASPLVQALVDSCQEVLQEALPKPTRVPALHPRLELQRIVEQALNHSKLVRLLKLTATDIPPGFET
jgi:hypothetical protein